MEDSAKILIAYAVGSITSIVVGILVVWAAICLVRERNETKED